MKTINWKGNISALIIAGAVIGSSAYVNYHNSDSTYKTPITASAASTNDNYMYKAVQDSNNPEKISIVPDSDTNNDSPFVNDDYMKDKSPDPTIGMTEQQVIDSSWGNTADKSTTKDSYGTSAMWFYDNGRSIFFIDGKVNSITQ
jgi:hypothetical protein